MDNLDSITDSNLYEGMCIATKRFHNTRSNEKLLGAFSRGGQKDSPLKVEFNEDGVSREPKKPGVQLPSRRWQGDLELDHSWVPCAGLRHFLSRRVCPSESKSWNIYRKTNGGILKKNIVLFLGHSWTQKKENAECRGEKWCTTLLIKSKPLTCISSKSSVEHTYERRYMPCKGRIILEQFKKIDSKKVY